jgi:hypothetical protein
MSKFQDWALALIPLSVVIAAAFLAMRNIPALWVPCGILVSVSVFAFAVTDRLIDQIKGMTLKAGLFGLDINKKGTPQGEDKMLGSCDLVKRLLCRNR